MKSTSGILLMNIETNTKFCNMERKSLQTKDQKSILNNILDVFPTNLLNLALVFLILSSYPRINFAPEAH